MGPVTLFSKHLGWLTIDQLGPVAAEIGFSAVQLTVRPGGHVEPERVADDLPRAVRTLRLAGVSVPSVVTSLTDPADDLTRRVLGTLSELGIRLYRMGWYELPLSHADASYEAAAPAESTGAGGTTSRRGGSRRAAAVRDALDRARDALERFARLNEQFGVRGCYENHAGAEIVGASPWNLWYLLRDLPPEWLGVEFDLRHALIEGWFSWEPAYELLRERIAAVLVKDFTWEVKPGAFPPARPIDVPLGDGVAPFTPLFASLDSDRFDGPVVMHFEYRMDGPGTTASGVAGREIQGTPGSVPGAPRDGFTQAAAHAIGRDLRKLRSIIRSGAV